MHIIFTVLKSIGIPTKVEYFKNYIITVNRLGRTTRWVPAESPRNRRRANVHARSRVGTNRRIRIGQRNRQPQTVDHNAANSSPRNRPLAGTNHRVRVGQRNRNPQTVNQNRANAGVVARNERARRRSAERWSRWLNDEANHTMPTVSIPRLQPAQVKSIQENLIGN